MSFLVAAVSALPSWFSVAASAVSAFGQLMSANSRADQFESAARAYDQNAMLIQAQAAEQERRQRLATSRLMAEQRVGYSKSGVVGGTGTPVWVATDTAMQGELDALTIRYNGEIKSNNERYQASMARYSASQTRTAGFLGAMGTLAGGVANYADKMNAVSPNPVYDSSAQTSGATIPTYPDGDYGWGFGFGRAPNRT